MDAGDTNRLTAAGLQLDTLQLGASSEEFETATRDEVAAVSQRLAAQAQRLLLLHTGNLSPEIHDRQAFLDAVRQFARNPIIHTDTASHMATTVREQQYRQIVLRVRMVDAHGYGIS